MNVPLWVAELANRFWSAAGTPEPFPRMLERPLTVAVPLSSVDVRVSKLKRFAYARDIALVVHG